jgi:hypothetical protein
VNIGRLIRTVRYLKPIQIWYQVCRRVQRGLEAHPKCGGEELPEFTFLNVTAKPRGWNDESLELLWRYNLHYFDWLNNVALTQRRRDAECAERYEEDIVLRWIDDNPRGSFPGWEPYPTSLRIVNWVKWLSSSRVEHVERVESSLKKQALYLRSHLEYHLLANHLLANAKALVFAGKYLDRRDLYEKGMSIYRKQLPEQTCGDGVNFERSPMYHAIIFEDMLDLAEFTDEELFKGYAAKMREGMLLLTGPDGKIAKFNDSAEGIAKQPTEMLARAEKFGCVEMEKGRGSGFLRQESGNYVLLAKCGEIGPSYQPGHAHADTYSFELWKSGKKVIGDTGCSTYIPGPIRSYERSTRAHNTVVIDGRDSSEVWASHRVGRRFGKKSHRREFELTEGGLKGVDSLGGSGEHDVEVRFHLPPGVAKDELIVECPGKLKWEECEIAEGWNVRKPGLCAVYSLRRSFPTTIEWNIK